MKALFFDIDGTLIDFDGKMSDSTRKALDMARAKGHKLILCTGRNAVQIYPVLVEYGFDGIVSAAGACVSCDGKEIYHNFVEPQQLKQFVDFFQNRHICYGIQAASASYMTEECYHLMRDKFLELGVGEDMMNTIMNKIIVDDNLTSHTDVEKMFYNNAPETVAQVQQALGDYFVVLQASIGIQDDYSGEVTCRGVMKATGMEHVLAYYGIDRKDSVAFGDGPNDLDMMEYAGIGVAMGNAMQDVKDVADMVTLDIHSDGIYHAMEKLELI